MPIEIPISNSPLLYPPIQILVDEVYPQIHKSSCDEITDMQLWHLGDICNKTVWRSTRYPMA